MEKAKNIEKELHKLGIHTQEELNEAIKNMKPLDITLMAGEPSNETVKEKTA